MKDRIKVFGILFGYCNFIFLPQWTNLIGEGVGIRVLMNPSPMLPVYVAIASILIGSSFIATFLYFLIIQTRKPSLARFFWLFVASTVLIPLNFLRQVWRIPVRSLLFLPPSASLTLVLFYIFLFCVFVVWLFFIQKKDYFTSATKTVGLLLLPFAFISVFNWAHLIFRMGYRSPASNHLNLSENREQRPKVVWLIFDEFDQRVVFESGAMKDKVPELNRLRKSSLYFKNAFSPADWTLNSLPSLISGVRVKTTYKGNDVRYANTLVHDFDLNLESVISPSDIKWSQLPNIFYESKALGIRSGIVGWYHGYCHLFMKSVDYCRRFSLSRRDYPEDYLPSAKEFLLRTMFPLSPKLDAPTYNSMELLQSVLNVLKGNHLDFIFVHFPFPHVPYISAPYNERAPAVRPKTSKEAYLANLTLVDTTIGQIRSVMEQNGSWKNSTVIVSSDHFWRASKESNSKDGKAVPYLIKMPDSKAVEIDLPVATIHTKDLILSILKKQIKTSSEALEWIKDKNKTFPLGSLLLNFDEEKMQHQKSQGVQPQGS